MALSSSTINANVSNDTFNTNDISSVNDTNKRNESTDLLTNKSDVKTLLKSKVDITDVLEDVPKPLKHYIATVEPQDEIDGVDLMSDELIQPKYEVNVTSNIETEANLEVKPRLPCKNDQWSPFNQDGKKIYDGNFLVALRNDPKSRRKPDNLLELVAQEDKGKIDKISNFIPNVGGSNCSSKSSSQRGAPPKRNSQHGKVGGGSKGKFKNLIIATCVSVTEDVKLHEAENAGINMSDD